MVVRSLRTFPLPADGWGLLPPRDPVITALHRAAGRSFWKRRRPLPPWAGGLAAKAALALLLPSRIRRLRRPWGLTLAESARIWADCFLYGLTPYEACLYRRECGRIPRDFVSDRVAIMLQGALGNMAQKDLLADKVRFADRLAQAGLAVVPTLLVLAGPDDIPSLTALPPGRYFLKPVAGFAGSGARPLIIPDAGGLLIQGGIPITRADLLTGLTAELKHHSLMVQPMLEAAPDLPVDRHAAGIPPVLRVTTSRRPGGPAEIHGIHAATAPDGMSFRWPRWRRYPIDPATASLGPPVIVTETTRIPCVWPWAGPAWPGLDRVIQLALDAADHVPDIPLVGWDIVPTPAGPVILEGNVHIGACWADLSYWLVGRPSPMAGVLHAWLERYPL
ncbi:hypothetical protein CHU95_02180 [Niveispirillum lacus]|uniref:Alpha-L-glutamate ligase-related protein ATP-grasp domain-containing protein n=1 Tax=Niveispirillum lacus TaxID=1981099 RepID=A0A255Z6K5_9PROT|nr:hypothetical protein [Niveispirillum lacus]OYQ37177.1 hypothetical protein CHU95_02180 [Niveispirillum lacus]